MNTNTLIVTLVLSALMLFANEHSVAQTRGPLEPSDTSSIRSTLNSFIDACNELDDLIQKQGSEEESEIFIPSVERILDCLDLSALPEELRERSGIESAVYLKEVIDRIQLPVDSELPNQLSSQENGNSTQWRIPGTRLAIGLIQSGASKGEYLFTVDTVRRANKFYSAAKALPYRNGGPKVSPDFLERFTALTKRQPKLSADTSSPRGTLTLFINTTNEVFEMIKSEKYIDRNDPTFLPLSMRIYSCLDLSELPDYSRDFYAAEAAVCIKEVLDRLPLPPPEEIPGSQDVKGGTGKDPILRWQIPNSNLTIARIEEGPRRGEYLFTAGSVDRATEMYKKTQNQPYQRDREISEDFYIWYMSAPANATFGRFIDSLPSSFKNRAGSLAVWQWIGLVLTMLVCLTAMALTYRIGRIQSQRAREKNLWQIWAVLIFPVVGIIVPLVFMHIVFEYLSMRGTALYVANFCGNLVFLIALMVVILGISTRIADSIIALPNIQSQGLDATLARIVCRLLGIIVATVIFLEGGRYLGFPITTLLASAGIGGLAIALSAQGMIKGLFGTITILLDKPFKVGERVIVKGHDGFVEEIGLRSTKIRSFMTNHLVCIPNDQMADIEVENIGRRGFIRRTFDLRIPIDTSREKVEKAIDIIRTILEGHEGMSPQYPPRVHFNDFNSDSFNIRATFWYHPPDFWDFQACSEQINLEIFQAFEENEIQFSLPRRLSYWRQDERQGPLDVRLTTSSEPND